MQPSESGCPIEFDHAIGAVLANSGDVHVWSLTSVGQRNLRVALHGLPADFDVHVFGPGGQLLGESLNEGIADDIVSLDAIPAGQYVIYVNSPRGLASFEPYGLLVTGEAIAPAPEPAPMPVPVPQPGVAPTPAPPTPPTPTPAGRSAISVDNAARVTTLRQLRGHSGWVQEVAPFADGRLLASAAADGVVKLWDLTTFGELRTIIAHRVAAEAVAVSPDGKLIASGADDGRLRIYDAANGREVYTFEPVQGAIRAVAFSPDGALVAASGDDMKVRLWDVRVWTLTGTAREPFVRPVRTFDHKAPVWSVAFAPHGKLMVTGSEDGTTRVWDTSSNGNEVRGLRGIGPARGVAVSSDGRLVAAGTERIIGVWSLESGVEVGTIEPGVATSAVAFAPGGRILAAAQDRHITLYEAETGRVVRTLQGHTAAILSLAFTPDGKLLVSGGKDGTVMVWGVE